MKAFFVGLVASVALTSFLYESGHARNQGGYQKTEQVHHRSTYQRTQKKTVVKSSTVRRQGRTVQITARDYDFSPDRIVVQRGTTLRVRFLNRGTHQHAVVFDFPSFDRKTSTLRPGQSTTTSFRVPNTRGAYSFYCPIGDHAERGMRGEIVVR